MRVFAQVLLIGILGGWVLAHPVTPAAQAPGRDPAPILAAAREALGGEKRLNAVKNFVATGRTRQVRGDNLVPIEFEIAVELPDKYVRKDEIPAQESGPTSTGFNGGELIQLPVPTAPAAPPGSPGARCGTSGTATGAVTSAAGCRKKRARGNGQAGLRQVDARNVCRVVPVLSPDLLVHRTS
jgi:hypothetical protein